MATISNYETKGGRRYRVRYRTPDRRQTDKRGFRTKRAAEDFAATVEVQKLTGSYIPPSAGRMTVGEYSEDWLEGKVNLTPSTKARYRSTLDVWVLPTWKSTSLTDVTTAGLQRWVAVMNKECAPATVAKEYAVLSQILAAAVRDKRLAASPAVGVDLPKRSEAERQYLTAVQVESLATAAGNRANVIYTLAYCGVRWGELAALRVRDVDLVRHRLTVLRSVTEVRGTLVWGTPKSGSGRVVPVPAFLVERLKGQIGGKDEDALVFPAPKGSAMRVRNARRDWFDNAVMESSCPEGLTPHELRHTCASLAIAAGAHIKTLQRLLGHTSAALTLDRYGHLFEDDLGTVAEKLDEVARAARTSSLLTAECGQNVGTNKKEALHGFP